MIRTYICDSLDESLRILGLKSEIVVRRGRWKNIFKIHGVSTRTQIKSDYSGEYITRKPLKSFTTHIHTLSKTHHFGTQLGPQSQKLVRKLWRKIYLLSSRYEPRTSPMVEMSISNESSNQALQVGHAHLRSSSSFLLEVDVYWLGVKKCQSDARCGISNRTQIRSDYCGKHTKKKD